jgi:hypothetical protein
MQASEAGEAARRNPKKEVIFSANSGERVRTER